MEQASDPPSFTVKEIRKQTVADLRKSLTKAGLPTKGSKKVLLKRMLEWVENQNLNARCKELFKKLKSVHSHIQEESYRDRKTKKWMLEDLEADVEGLEPEEETGGDTESIPESAAPTTSSEVTTSEVTTSEATENQGFELLDDNESTEAGEATELKDLTGVAGAAFSSYRALDLDSSGQDGTGAPADKIGAVSSSSPPPTTQPAPSEDKETPKPSEIGKKILQLVKGQTVERTILDISKSGKSWKLDEGLVRCSDHGKLWKFVDEDIELVQPTPGQSWKQITAADIESELIRFLKAQASEWTAHIKISDHFANIYDERSLTKILGKKPSVYFKQNSNFMCRQADKDGLMVALAGDDTVSNEPPKKKRKMDTGGNASALKDWLANKGFDTFYDKLIGYSPSLTLDKLACLGKHVVDRLVNELSLEPTELVIRFAIEVCNLRADDYVHQLPTPTHAPTSTVAQACAARRNAPAPIKKAVKANPSPRSKRTQIPTRKTNSNNIQRHNGGKIKLDPYGGRKKSMPKLNPFADNKRRQQVVQTHQVRRNIPLRDEPRMMGGTRPGSGGMVAGGGMGRQMAVNGMTTMRSRTLGGGMQQSNMRMASTVGGAMGLSSRMGHQRGPGMALDDVYGSGQVRGAGMSGGQMMRGTSSVGMSGGMSRNAMGGRTTLTQGTRLGGGGMDRSLMGGGRMNSGMGANLSVGRGQTPRMGMGQLSRARPMGSSPMQNRMGSSPMQDRMIPRSGGGGGGGGRMGQQIMRSGGGRGGRGPGQDRGADRGAGRRW